MPNEKTVEIDVLDGLVTKYNLCREICPNRSKLVNGFERIPSDMLFDHDGMFLVKRIAQTSMNYDSDKLSKFSPADCAQFYREHNLFKYHSFSQTFMTEGNKALSNWYFKGRSAEYMRFLAYRWDNDLLFCPYKERVIRCLEVRNLEHSNAARDTIESMREIEGQLASLNDELSELVDSQKLSPELEDRLRGITFTVQDLIDEGD